MTSKAVSKAMLVLALALVWSWIPPDAAAQDTIALASPRVTGGKPLFEALALRRSERSYKTDALSNAQISQLLWAAFGTNRGDDKRTIPTAMGKNELRIYAAVSTGVYLYEAEKNVLTLALAGDYTSQFANAPLTLVFAAQDNAIGGMHVGSAYQNVGLYCASEGLTNVVKGSGVDVLRGKLPLPEGYSILVLQLVGIPK
jgi:hypothetical protein